MIPSPTARATLLLTVAFGAPEASRPLSVKEWARFAPWLRDRGLDPSSLLEGDLAALLSGWADRTITPSRLDALVGRAGALDAALERWRRADLWIVTRSDPEYPGRLKRRLGQDSPPVLFGCGAKALLDRGGVAVVGSRDAAPEDVAFAERLGAMAAREGRPVVSGGARGIDASAMSAALANGGDVVGVLPGGLSRAAGSAGYREGLRAGNLALASPVAPEEGFSVGAAMARNRYIYCLADAAVAVCSVSGRGGTWHGAVDNLRAARAPLWVGRTRDAGSGNPDLVRMGARWIPGNLESLAQLVDAAPAAAGADG